ncbi:PstS family phosphate ABC transporter substrate-binding protein [Aurantibacillus circumpalustris]|uniref:PstS family phosphate ABC transporter substrate-binding protein n=1 Tax=Aurantibacillus circumpalustris TaxID=3036359 RepID=UPI00295BAE6D|nr:substrate-binding domain-containing protein [Aurantibacillus circumpalustris]
MESKNFFYIKNSTFLLLQRGVIYILIGSVFLVLNSCSDYYKNDYKDNSPTSGKLKVYYDEGLALHIKNQVTTFESQYPNVEIDLYQTSENEAVQALYNDSCEAIAISRLLTEKEKKAFASKDFFPNYSAVAKSGIALITNVNTSLNFLSYEQIVELLKQPYSFKDSLGNSFTLNVLFDKNNSAVLHYMMDSILKETKLSVNCNILNSTLESINYVAENKNTVAFIDFAWLSDVDDSIYKANKNKIKFIGISKPFSSTFECPNQSSFKLNNYAFTRTVYVIRKTGDFTLAKGFESFVAGPKGQLTFLKQGLLPNRQSERALNIKMGGETTSEQ